MNANPPALYALLVGINRYANPRVRNLGGCINDIDAMEQLLRNRFGVPEANIRKLTDSEATHQVIKDAFRRYLIKHAHDCVNGGGQGTAPAFLFHFSGHGSQAVDPTGIEPDGLDETIVPHDSRTPGVYDIKDWELALLLDELTVVSDNVTVILDCCHSGSGTRDTASSIVPVRRCDPDLRPQPTQRPEKAIQLRGAATGSGWMQADRYILIAACRDKELANEMLVKEGAYRRQHGALSYFLIRELAQMNPERRLTYRELHGQVGSEVNTLFRTQMPQCEGDREREVFGGLRPAQDDLLTVVEKDQGLVWVNGGLAHGLTEGSELHAYPPQSRKLAEAGLPLATLTVQSVGAVSSSCTINQNGMDVPIHARVAIYRLHPEMTRRQVLLDILVDFTRNEVRALLQQDIAANIMEEAPSERPAEFRIQLLGDQLQLQDGTGRMLVAPYEPQQTEELINDLMHLVRYLNALDLRNRASNSALSGAINLEIKRRNLDPISLQPIAQEFELTAGGELAIDVDQEIVLEITNRYHKPLYVGLFEFGYEWDIVQWYPMVQGAHEALAPGKTLSIGLGTSERIAFGLPERLAEVRETFKVIATVNDTDFDILTMSSLKSPFQPRDVGARSFTDSSLNQLFDLAMENRPDTRAALKQLHPSAKDEWTTVQQRFLVTQPGARSGSSVAVV